MKPIRVEVIDRVYAGILASKTPAERVAMILDCNRTARALLAAGERMRHPDWSDAKVSEMVSCRVLGKPIDGAD